MNLLKFEPDSFTNHEKGQQSTKERQESLHKLHNRFNKKELHK